MSRESEKSMPLLLQLSILDDKLVFAVADRTKTTQTSLPGKSHTKIEIPRFPRDKKLCPRTHVLYYIDKTT